jgi:aldehyde:ferredoxin oxidoreductase
MGAVMGSKNLKALVIEGTGILPAASPNELREEGLVGYREILAKPSYAFWKRQGTMSTIEWANQINVLPTFNFREGFFEDAEKIGGHAEEAIKVSNRGCPNCNMTCGNVVKDFEGRDSELDYENIALLGSNLGIGDLAEASVLNRVADEFGLDSISLGNVLGFAMEASEKGLIKEKMSWGNLAEAKALSEDIAFRRGIGNLFAEGVQNAAMRMGGDSARWAMHVKGLEISGYDCHSIPAMALSYATSPIGAHHKDAWVVGWEIQHDRFGYGEEKATHVVETQHLRGVFECLGVCRFPLVNLGFNRDWYPKYLQLTTGQTFTWEALNLIAERVFNLIRAFWIRECKGIWHRRMDDPPSRWFDEPLSKGNLKGAKLDRAKYDALLQSYYRKRGWTATGLPTKATLDRLDLSDVAQQLGAQ